MQYFTKHIGYRLVFILVMLCTACNLNYISPIPDFPVRLQINTNTEFTTFWNNPGTYLTFEEPRLSYDRIGFSGIVVVCDFDNKYYAYDLCCPNEAKQNIKVKPDGIFATCEVCNETYDMSFGMGTPTKGISKHPLKRYVTREHNRIISVSLK